LHDILEINHKLDLGKKGMIFKENLEEKRVVKQMVEE